jgi:hypothetical protein
LVSVKAYWAKTLKNHDHELFKLKAVIKVLVAMLDLRVEIWKFEQSSRFELDPKMMVKVVGIYPALNLSWKLLKYFSSFFSFIN